MGALEQFAAVAAGAWDASKSDVERQIEAVTGQDATPEPVIRYRIRLHVSYYWHKCRICGRYDKWTLEGDTSPVYVCEWETPEHQPIEAGRLGVRAVDSVPYHQVNFAEMVNLEE